MTQTKADKLRTLVRNQLEVQKAKPRFDENTSVEELACDVESWQIAVMSTLKAVRDFDKAVNIRFEHTDCNGQRIADYLTRGHSASMTKSIKAWAKS